MLFRYFGRYENLRDINEMVAQFRPEQLAGIDCLPIFDSLYELGIADHFDRCTTVHGCIESRALGGRWRGFKPGQVAITVINSIQEANS